MSTLTFKEIVDRVSEGNLGGDEIAHYRNFCASWLFRFNTEYGELVASGAMWQTANQEKHKSQASCERAWQATPEGQKEIRLKYKIRGIEHINDALLTNHMLLQRELKEVHAVAS